MRSRRRLTPVLLVLVLAVPATLLLWFPLVGRRLLELGEQPEDSG